MAALCKTQDDKTNDKRLKATLSTNVLSKHFAGVKSTIVWAILQFES